MHDVTEIELDGRATWLFADGTTLPVIRGAEDGDDLAPADPVPDSAGAPEVDQTADPAPADPAPADPETPPTLEQMLETWGGQESVEDAIAIKQALQTEEGVTQLVFEGLRSLGFGVREIQAFIETGVLPNQPAAATASGDAPEAPDPEGVPTRAEVEDMLRKLVMEPLEAREQEWLQAAQTDAVTSVLNDDLKIEDPDARQAILQLGQKYISEGDEDPATLAAAVRRGHADYMAMIEREAKAYLTKKQQTRDTTPAPLSGGGSPGGSADEELTYEKFGNNVLQEAMKRARQRVAAGD